MLAYILALAVGFGSLAIYMAAFFFPEVHRKGDFVWSGVGLFYALVLWVCSGRITGGVLLGQVASVALLGWAIAQTLSLRRQLTPHLSQTEVPTAGEVKSTLQEKVSQSSFFSKLSQFTKRGSDSAATAKNRLQQNLSEQKAQVPETSAATNTNNSQVKVIDNRTTTAAPIEVAVTPANLAESEPQSLPQGLPDSAAEVPQTPSEATSDIPQTESTPSISADAVADEATAESEELVRPNPPDPELVEAALKDAEKKHQEAVPPEPETPENPSPS